MSEGTNVCEQKESDLVTLETRSEQTLINIRKAKVRLSNLLDGLKKSEVCESDCSAEASIPAPNRLIEVVNKINDIDNESNEFNTIITKLEEILK